MRKRIYSFNDFLIKENSTPEYDEILDLYNQVGLEGMSKDEVDFLKSGGNTKLPNRFKQDVPTESEKLDGLKTLLLLNNVWIVDFPYNGLGYGLDNLFCILFRDEDLLDELITIMYGSKENYEKENNNSNKRVFIRTDKDWSKESNTHRKNDEIPGPEYKLSVVVSKENYEYLTGKSLSDNNYDENF